MSLLADETGRVFQGRGLPLVELKAVQNHYPGQTLLFEVARGRGLGHFRRGYLIARSPAGQENFHAVIKAYRRAYPKATFYLAGAISAG